MSTALKLCRLDLKLRKLDLKLCRLDLGVSPHVYWQSVSKTLGTYTDCEEQKREKGEGEEMIITDSPVFVSVCVCVCVCYTFRKVCLSENDFVRHSNNFLNCDVRQNARYCEIDSTTELQECNLQYIILQLSG